MHRRGERDGESVGDNPVPDVSGSSWWLVLLVVGIPVAGAVIGKLVDQWFKRRAAADPSAEDAIDRAFTAMAAEQTRRLRTLEHQTEADRRALADLHERLSSVQARYGALKIVHAQSLADLEQLRADKQALTEEIQQLRSQLDDLERGRAAGEPGQL